MINSILLNNFQSHKNTEIDFHPGVNVIVGHSDSGKSAILRGLYWCIFNKPGGEGFMSKWGGPTGVTLHFDDGILSRERNKKFNGYILEGQEYKGMGQKVPEPVADFVNMTAINFQRQLDPPFMLSWNPGERGVFLNNISNLNAIDSSLTKVKKMVAGEKSEIANCVSLIESLEKSEKEFEYLPDLEKTFLGLERTDKRLSSLSDSQDDLLNLIEALEETNTQIEEAGEILKAEEKVKKLESIHKKYLELKQKSNVLRNVLEDIEDLSQEISEYKTRVTYMIDEFAALMPDECPLCGE